MTPPKIGNQDEAFTGVVKLKSGKFRGEVPDLVFAALFPGKKQRTQCTPSFESVEDAAAARTELRRKVAFEYEEIIVERASNDKSLDNVPRAPLSVASAEPKKAYWVCNSQTGHRPKRMVRMATNSKQGTQWTAACALCPIDCANRGLVKINGENYCKSHARELKLVL